MKRQRAGQSLLLLMLLLLVLAGVMALTFDFGFVLLSRRTMQTAANSAAIEGAYDTDGNGRQDARRVIRNLFDDDLDPTTNNTTLGAGIDHSLVTVDGSNTATLGAGTNARDLYLTRSQYIYRPDPQLNEANQDHGDLVRGIYDSDGAQHTESNVYQRDDFQSDEDGTAFLVRLRRTPIRDGVANLLDRQVGVSSSGTGSPLLIGRLAPFTPSQAGGYDIRRDGVSIRATAIADGKAIVHVGSATHAGIFSSIRFAFSAVDNQWYELDETHSDIGEIATLADSDPVDFGSIPDSLAIGYAPVVSAFAGTRYVVGFRLNDRGQSRRSNASPRLQDAWGTLSALPETDRDFVLSRHDQLAEDQDSYLARSPALVQATR